MNDVTIVSALFNIHREGMDVESGKSICDGLTSF